MKSMLEVTFSTSAFRFPNIQLIDHGGQTLPFKKKRVIDFGLKYGRIENEMILGDTSPEDIKSSTNPFVILLKDFLRHPKFFCFRFVKTWKIQTTSMGDISLPVDIKLQQHQNPQIWVSRQASVNGFLPRDLEVSSELNYLRAPSKFDLMVRSLKLFSKSAYQMYDDGSYEIQQLPTRMHPALEHLTFENVRLISGKLILSRGMIIPISNYRQEKSVHQAGFLKANDDGTYRVIKTFEEKNSILQSGIFVGSSTSWFHFVVECLPRLMTIPAKIRYGVPVILPKDTPIQIVELCEILTKVPPIFVGLMENKKVERIEIGQENGVVNPLEFSFRKARLKEAILEIETSFNQTVSLEIFPKKIYVQRPKGLFRPLQNEASIRKMLEKQEFETIQPEELNLKQVFNIFSNAKLIVAESGAAITNVLFAKSGTHLIELYPGKGPMDFWPELASISDVTVSKVLSVPAVIGPKGIARDGIYVSKSLINKEVKQSELFLAPTTH